MISAQIESDLLKRRIKYVISIYLFISFLLGLVLKYNEGFRRIHYFSHPIKHSVNNYIKKEYEILIYITLVDIIEIIVRAGREFLIIKKDVKKTFRIVLIVLY